MSERLTATFLITATGQQRGVVFGVASAFEALAKMRQLRAEGLAPVVFDGCGLEYSAEALQNSVSPVRGRS